MFGARLSERNPTSSTNQIGEIAAGTNQILVRITFTVAMNAAAGATPLTFTNVNGSNDEAQSLAISSQSGTLTITGPMAGSVSVGGRVMTAHGRGIRNVVITMTDRQGNTRTATTSSFGYYQFQDVAAGETYILTATGKRFRFGENTQVHSITEDNENINFVADELLLSP